MSDLVQVHIPRFLSNFRSRIEDLRDDILENTAPILRREQEASIREKFYRTGTGLRSLQDEIVTEGQKKVYRLFPTAFYMIFGEYGTGRRGSVSGRPTPRGWRYGQKPGMTARRYSRIAVDKARPQIDRVANERAKAFARNVTVN